jgi:NAD(P)-dependent dehydrogenase (short-subunit alcohol dehydrogenase family)
MKTVIITGASRGIGLATVKKFLAEGWRVIGTYLNSPIDMNHPDLISIQYDQGDSSSVAKVASQIIDLAFPLDALINNAGVLLDTNDIVADPIKIRKTLEINLVGVIDLTERLLPLFFKGSQIVNIDSGYGAMSIPIDDESVIGYRLAKVALNMYTRHLAFRLQTRGMVVSSLAPGWVKTDMGYSVSTETEKPDREPEQAANDIFQLVTTVKESGQFWKLGEKIAW